MTEYAARDAAMVAAYICGASYRSIAQAQTPPLSTERVRQILHRLARKHEGAIRRMGGQLLVDATLRERLAHSGGVASAPGRSWAPHDTTSIDDLDLSTRAYNALKGFEAYTPETGRWQPAPLDTVAKIRAISDAELWRTPNVGRKTLREVREVCGDEFPYRRLEYQQSLRDALNHAHWIVSKAVREKGLSPDLKEIVVEAFTLADQLEDLARRIDRQMEPRTR